MALTAGHPETGALREQFHPEIAGTDVRKHALQPDLKAQPLAELHDLPAGSIELLIEDGFISRRELLRETGLSAEDVRSLAGLPDGFFDSDPPNLIRLKPSVRRQGDGDDPDGGTVVPFGRRRK